jgi:hypothetical protein
VRNAELFRGALELPDDDRNDPHADETPEPCRGCNRTDCGEQCAEFRAWLTVVWLQVDTADRASQAAYTHRWGDADARP